MKYYHWPVLNGLLTFGFLILISCCHVATESEEYINPPVSVNPDTFVSNCYSIGKAKAISEADDTTVNYIASKNEFNLTSTLGEPPIDVLVMNAGTEKVATYFIDDMNNDSSTGIVLTTSIKAHKRKISSDNLGYQTEVYDVVIQSSGKKIIAIHIAREGTDDVYTYWGSRL